MDESKLSKKESKSITKALNINCGLCGEMGHQKDLGSVDGKILPFIMSYKTQYNKGQKINTISDRNFEKYSVLSSQVTIV